MILRHLSFYSAAQKLACNYVHYRSMWLYYHKAIVGIIHANTQILSKHSFTLNHSCYNMLIISVPLMMVFTFINPIKPPITNTSVGDKTATAFLDRGIGRSLT